MAKLICDKCKNTYFKKIVVNQFHDYNGTINHSLPEVNIDDNIILYECLNRECCHIMTPTIGYNNPEEERELSTKLKGIIRGDLKALSDREKPLPKAIKPGQARTRGREESDPSNQGKFVRRY